MHLKISCVFDKNVVCLKICCVFENNLCVWINSVFQICYVFEKMLRLKIWCVPGMASKLRSSCRTAGDPIVRILFSDDAFALLVQGLGLNPCISKSKFCDNY